MNHSPDVITVNRKALLDAVIELEHQYTIEFIHLTACMTQLEQTYRVLHQLIETDRLSTAKQSLFQFLFPNDGFTITDHLFDTWAKEAEDQHQTLLNECSAVGQDEEDGHVPQ